MKAYGKKMRIVIIEYDSYQEKTKY